MIYMFLENGFEETEAIATLDFIRRANIEIKTVSEQDVVVGSHQIKVIPDMNLKDATFSDLTGIILPGGQPGTNNLKKNQTVLKFIEFANEKKLLIGAICAAPSILGELDYLKGKEATAYPGYEEKLLGAKLSLEKVVQSEHIITAKGMGVSVCFGAKIVEYLKGKQIAQEILDSIYG